MTIKAIPLASIGVGTLFVYSGLKGAGFSATLAELVQGKKPSGTDIYGITGNVLEDGSSSSILASGSVGGIAGVAESYAGKVPYVWGGATTSGWDCSGMVNRILQMSGHSIPGSTSGSFSGHGPTTLQYLIWTGAKNIPRASAAANDLAVWPTHMGICVSNSQMVSAVDEAEGTKLSAIQGPAGEPLVIRRIIS